MRLLFFDYIFWDGYFVIDDFFFGIGNFNLYILFCVSYVLVVNNYVFVIFLLDLFFIYVEIINGGKCWLKGCDIVVMW